MHRTCPNPLPRARGVAVRKKAPVVAAALVLVGMIAPTGTGRNRRVPRKGAPYRMPYFLEGVLVRRLAIVVGVLVLGGCTAQAQQPTPAASARSDPPTEVVPQTATLIYSRQGVGPATISPTVGPSVKIVTVRFTCVGKGVTSIRSVGGGLIMRTDGCLAGEVFGSSFTRSARLDPSRLTVTVDPSDQWQLQVWSGKFVVPPAPTAG